MTFNLSPLELAFFQLQRETSKDEEVCNRRDFSLASFAKRLRDTDSFPLAIGSTFKKSPPSVVDERGSNKVRHGRRFDGQSWLANKLLLYHKGVLNKNKYDRRITMSGYFLLSGLCMYLIQAISIGSFSLLQLNLTHY
jgi:hypothetical protein